MRRTLSFVAAALLCATALVVSPDADAAFADVEIELTQIAMLDEPIAMATRFGDPTHFFFAEKDGAVKRYDTGTTAVDEVLDIRARVRDSGSEQGLLGIAFSPDGAELLVNYTNNAGDTVVETFPYAVPVDETQGGTVIGIGQPSGNHNGGNIAFGPDGYLYIGMGDGGRANDPGNRAQSKRSLLGKMLRIQPTDGGGYDIPADNPYVGRRGRDEIWAKGLRNPWRWSFDTGTGDLWIGDVGQSAREELNRQTASSSGGENYGWRRMEGTKNNIGKRLPNKRHHKPVHQYTHAHGCSVTGGYVYRGSAIPDLAGAYVFGDFCAGDVRAFPAGDPSQERDLLSGAKPFSLYSFGRDAGGELYVLSSDGSVSRIDPA